MQTTANYGLKKPEQNDAYNIENENENMDILDKKMNDLENKVDNIELEASKVSFTSTFTNFTSKNVKLALDYLFQLANDGKKYWVDVVGIPLAISDTFATLKAKTQTIKNTIATNITSKGVPVSNTDTLNNLADAIGRISLKTLNGYKLISGTATPTMYTTGEYVRLVMHYHINIPELVSYKVVALIINGTMSIDSYHPITVYPEGYYISSELGKFGQKLGAFGTGDAMYGYNSSYSGAGYRIYNNSANWNQIPVFEYACPDYASINSSNISWTALVN